MLIVPELRGLYYVEAQQRLLAAGFGIAAPTWVINPGPDTSPATADITITADSASITADSLINIPPIIARPFYVLQQSIPSGSQFGNSPLVVVALTVIGIPVPTPGGGLVAVP